MRAGSSGPGRYAPLLGLWLAALIVAVALLWKYKETPGASAATPARWPADSALLASAREPTLVLFAHPRCACTRATLTELAEVMARFQGRVSAHVLFTLPHGAPSAWQRGESWQQASAIPGVELGLDREGREAARFGARTSGHVVLYAANGKLLFSGGITGGRGHVGENQQLDRLLERLSSAAETRPLAHGMPARAETPPAPGPVFGCAMTKAEESMNAAR